ncbi:Crystal ET79 [Fusarium pseudocircinatum]|uniref:Crystal ET79 n=1 Tax=Fusarium pseudocircinatum TaxID=56676 RepID=A0A8H5USL9_9HYPO|nr:Crystal ET79 [Fusarium pseudocircinatum]
MSMPAVLGAFAATDILKDDIQSTTITISNKLSEVLILQSSNMDQGVWVQPDPSLGTRALPQPANVNAGEEAIFMAGSNVEDQSNKGSLVYSTSVGTFTFNFDNPYNGANSYSESGPTGYMLTRTGGHGDNASVKWVVESDGRALSDLGGAIENVATAAEDVVEDVISADVSAYNQTTPSSRA